MNWKYNQKTGKTEPDGPAGVEVTARQGGVMVEDRGRNVRFLINYGNGLITHCIGCRPENLHLFADADARKIAERIRRIGTGKGLDEIYFDWKTYSINNYKNMRTNENHIYRINEFNKADKSALEDLYLGKTIRIIRLQGEDSRYAGKTGEVEYIDDIGQLHGTWGGLAVIPDTDSFEVVE